MNPSELNTEAEFLQGSGLKGIQLLKLVPAHSVSVSKTNF